MFKCRNPFHLLNTYQKNGSKQSDGARKFIPATNRQANYMAGNKPQDSYDKQAAVTAVIWLPIQAVEVPACRLAGMLQDVYVLDAHLYANALEFAYEINNMVM